MERKEIIIIIGIILLLGLVSLGSTAYKQNLINSYEFGRDSVRIEITTTGMIPYYNISQINNETITIPTEEHIESICSRIKQ